MHNARVAGSGGEVTETIEGVLRVVEASIVSRLRPAIAQRPLQTLSQAAAAGFVLGILVPVRLQALALRPLVAFGLRQLLASEARAGRPASARGRARATSGSPPARPPPSDIETLTR